MIYIQADFHRGLGKTCPFSETHNGILHRGFEESVEAIGHEPSCKNMSAAETTTYAANIGEVHVC